MVLFWRKKHLKLFLLQTDGKFLIFSEKQTQGSSIFETYFYYRESHFQGMICRLKSTAI